MYKKKLIFYQLKIFYKKKFSPKYCHLCKLGRARSLRTPMYKNIIKNQVMMVDSLVAAGAG